MVVRTLALAASVLLLTACAPVVELPPPITQAEVKRMMAEGNQQWWQSMFPDEAMPVVDPVEFVDPREPADKAMDCLRAADLEGISFTENGWSTTGNSQAQNDEVNRAMFVCQMQYPYDISDPSALGYVSDEQARWLWYFHRDRLVPCLQMLGYTVTTHPEQYTDGSMSVIPPYYEMYPRPADEDWALIDFRCPPSPVGPDYRPRPE